MQKLNNYTRISLRKVEEALVPADNLQLIIEKSKLQTKYCVAVLLIRKTSNKSFLKMISQLKINLTIGKYYS